jgi:4-amino-4-deoxy-L-arabinose transferase-like glycosyltransferase
MWPRPRSLLPLLLICALALRIAFFICVVGPGTTGWGDEPGYHRLASSVADGRGLAGSSGEPTAKRSPLYPVLLGGVYRVFGPRPDAGRILQTLLGTAIVLLVYLTAGRFFSAPIPLLAAALAAINPSLVYMSALLMTENLYVILLLSALLVLTSDRRSVPAPPSKIIIVGLLLGLGCLTRPAALAFALLACAALVGLGTGRFVRRLATSALLLLAVLIAVSPWILRNHARFDACVVLTTQGGITFYESNNRIVYDNPEYHGTIAPSRTELPGWETLVPLSEVEFDREAWRLARYFVARNPGLLPRLIARKFVRFWRFESGLELECAQPERLRPGVHGAVDLIRVLRPDFVYFAVVIPLFILGVVLTGRRYRSLALLYALVLSHALVAVAFHGSLRARMPAEPAIVIFAAAGMVGARSWFKRAARARRA